MSSVSHSEGRIKGVANEEAAFARAMDALTPDAVFDHRQLRETAALVEQGQFAPASARLQAFLKSEPQNIGGLYLAGEIAARQGGYADAEPLFARCVDLDPEFKAARFHYANVMLETGKPEGALVQAQE